MSSKAHTRRYGTGVPLDRAVPAEEAFPCECAQAQSCTECSCACCPLPTAPCPSPIPEPEPVEAPCCCKASMAEALRLLCDPTLASLVDFDAFFFLTDSLSVGGALNAPTTTTDNLAAITASFRRFSPCNCDLLDVGGSAYFAHPGTATLVLEDVDQINLCSVRAVAFQLTADMPDEPTTPYCEPYQIALRSIRRAIQAEGGTTNACGSCGAHCDCDNCCCNAGILAELSTRNLSRQATLTAGPLVLQNVTVVGSLGSVLVLTDEATERFYLVCTNSVEVLG